ncbi:MAG: Flp family type IVb pilin [Rhodovulum sp.]
MKLFELIKRFHNDESGAVTVDWVVLTAAIVGLGIAVLSTVKTGVDDLAGDIESALTSASVNSLGTLGWDGSE